MHTLGYAIAYGVGVFLSKYYRLPLPPWEWLWIVPAGLLVLHLCGRPRQRAGLRILMATGNLALLLACWGLGSQAWQATDNPLPTTGTFSCIATIEETPSPTRRLVQVHHAFDAGRWHDVQRRIALRCRRRDSILQNAKRGETYLLLLAPTEVAPPNPHAFSYGDWQRRHGIVGSYEACPGLSSRLGSTTPPSPGWFKRMHQTMEQRLMSLPLDERARGLIIAMSLGEKSHLPAEVRAAFQQSGLAHVLALSGLHVGIIYGFIYGFSQLFLSFTLWRRMLRYGLPLLGVWLFTAIVGFSPSLLRAAAMLTALTWHKVSLGSNRPLGSIALAALLILLLDPLSLWDMGFQLSFAAVLGILGFYRPLRSLWHTHRWVLRWSWELMCVSTAAQLGTLPLVLMHFGTFPTFSLLSNLCAIPLVTVLVPITLLAALLPQGLLITPFLSEVIGWLSSALLWCTDHVATLPYAQLVGLRIDPLWALILTGGLTAVTIALWSKRRTLLWAGGALIGVVAIGLFLKAHTTWQQEEWVAFHSPGISLVSHRQGRHIRFVSTRPSPWGRRIIDDYASGIPLASIHDASSDSHVVTPTPAGRLIRLGGQSILLADPMAAQTHDECEQTVDVLVAGHCPDSTLATLTWQLSPGLVLADGSTPSWRIAALRQLCEQAGTPLHSTYTQGYRLWRAAR